MLSSVLGALALMTFSFDVPLRTDQPHLFPLDASLRAPVGAAGVPYHPRPGDVVLYDAHSPLITGLYQLCGTGGPLHVAVVYARPDGTLATLEAGPKLLQKVYVFDVAARLESYDGTILVRRLKTPLTAEQSQQLTQFCAAQEGKSYAIGRLLLQATPFRARGSWRTHYLGKTSLERDRWICSELVIAALTVADVLNAKEFPATSFYPRDLCYDEEGHDLSRYYERPHLWYPQAELEATGLALRMRK